MKNTIKFAVFGVVFWMLVFASVAFSQTGQNTNRWELYGGKWDLFTAYNDSTTNDTLFVRYKTGTDSVYYSEAFRVWPYMSVVALVDTVSAKNDSIKFQVEFMQSGEGFTVLDRSNYVRVRKLSWQSTSSSSTNETISSVGKYAANVTDEPIHPYRFGRLRVETSAGHTLLNSIVYTRFIINGWNDK